MLRPFLAAWLVVAFGCASAAADDPAQAPISTDRPAVTDSSVVVPAGSLQAENGFARSVSHGQDTFDGPETLLRFGALPKTELRFTVPDYFGPVKSGSGTTSQAGAAEISSPYTADPSVKGMPPGFYRVEITKDGTAIPAKYNTETILGAEVAGSRQGQNGLAFDLEY